MSQNKNPLSSEEKWALAIKAVNRRIGVARAKRLPRSADWRWKTASVGDTKFAAERLAAITLAALRLQERDPDPTLDARLVATWNEMRFVIEENIQATLRRREEALEDRIREGQANAAECHTRLMACYGLERTWRSYAERLRERDYAKLTQDDSLVKMACFEICANQLRVALGGFPTEDEGYTKLQ